MTTMPVDPQESLLSRMRGGDDSAYSEFVHTYSGRMMAVARRLLRNEDDAADALQDGFFSAFKSLGHFNGNSALGTWLHRIIVNACLMKLRSRGRRADCSLEDLVPTFDHSGHHVEPVSRWSGPPDETLQREEVKTRIRACIDELPEEYRVVLVLRDIEELDTEQTADLLNVTIGAVKTRLHRARQALRTLLEPHFVG